MRKTKLIILTLVLFFVNLNGASIKFAKDMNYEINYEKALKKAKEQNKPIMMVIGTKTCPWCRKLERQTLKKDMVNDIVSKSFIPLSLTRGIDSYPKHFNAKVVPTVFFIDPKEQKAFHISYGYKNKKVFRGVVNKALKQFN